MNSLGCALLLALAMYCGNAFAALTSQAVDQPSERVTGVSQIGLGKGPPRWIHATFTADGWQVTMQPFAEQEARRTTFRMDDPAMLLAAAHTLSTSNRLVVAYNGPNYEQRIARLDPRTGRIAKGSPVEGLLLALEVLEHGRGFAVAGIGSDGAASVVFIDRGLRSVKNVRFLGDKRGEASALLAFGDKLIALTNHENGEGHLDVLSQSGDVLSTQRLAGGAATGVVARGGEGLVVTYRVGNEILVERLDRAFKSIWVSKLHDVEKIHSRKARVLEVPNGFVWVGANNDRLVVYRLDWEGRMVERSVDEASGYGKPVHGMYNAVAIGSTVHIRGVGMKTGGELGSFELFHFVDRPK